MPKNKMVIGFATYGRSFTLTSDSSGVGAPATTGPAGPYTNQAGFMAYYEVILCVREGWGKGRLLGESGTSIAYCFII